MCAASALFSSAGVIDAAVTVAHASPYFMMDSFPVEGFGGMHISSINAAEPKHANG
jgi:hypothetical protein